MKEIKFHTRTTEAQQKVIQHLWEKGVPVENIRPSTVTNPPRVYKVLVVR